MINIYEFLPPLFGAIIGVLLKYAYDFLHQKYKFKRELDDNNNVDVTGEWFAAWQTSIDGNPLINTEHIKILQKGKTLKIWNIEKSPENPKGGYLWEGQMQFLQGRNVMGWYFPKKEENNTSKGIIYMTYISPRKEFIGKWVGTAYDGELISGMVIISKDRSGAKERLNGFILRHPHDVRIISYSES